MSLHHFFVELGTHRASCLCEASARSISNNQDNVIFLQIIDSSFSHIQQLIAHCDFLDFITSRKPTFCCMLFHLLYDLYTLLLNQFDILLILIFCLSFAHLVTNFLQSIRIDFFEFSLYQLFLILVPLFNLVCSFILLFPFREHSNIYIYIIYKLGMEDDILNDQNVITIAVVGGGLSGLTAADEILKKNKARGSNLKKIEVYVLEAMDRVGGRTLTIDIEGFLYDLGGQWVGRTQKYAQKLAERAGNELYPQYHTGTKILDLNRKVSTYRTNIPLNVGILPLIEMQTLIWKIDRMAKTVDLQYPHKCSQAQYWDSLTLHSWLLANCYSSNIKKLIECAIRAVFGVETDELSFLFFLWYTHQSEGIQNLINIENGLQEMKMVKGAQYLSQYLKKQICKEGGKVLNNVFVSKIEKVSEMTYHIYDRKNRKYQANYVIMAMPPSCMTKINFEPQLSRTRRLICERSFMGSCSKVILFYEEMYWRNNGFSGETLSDCLQTPIFNAYDDSRKNRDGKIQPAILVFMNASVDRQWSLNREASQKIIKETLCTYFKDQRMLSPKSITWKVWSEEQSLNGAPISVFPPGVLSKIDNIREPEDNIHWAGTEMATKSQGFMDGAIESGQRCARQITQKLQSQNNKFPKQTHPQAPQISKYTSIIEKSKKLFQWL